MIHADYLGRRIKFIADSFFEKVEVINGSKTGKETDTRLELSNSFLTSSFPEGEEVNFLLKDITEGREWKFDFFYTGRIYYKENKKPIRVVFGTDYRYRYDEIEKEIGKMENAHQQHIGTYLFCLETSIPRNLKKLLEN